jgi:membrane-associated phospholipid phosphatase
MPLRQISPIALALCLCLSGFTSLTCALPFPAPAPLGLTQEAIPAPGHSDALLLLPPEDRPALFFQPSASSPATPPPPPSHDRRALPLVLLGVGLSAITIDNRFHFVIQDEHVPALDPLTKSLNALGQTPVLLATTGALYLFDDHATGKRALAALLNAGVLTEVTKQLTGRARPYVAGDAGEFTGPTSNDIYKSFPSGHAAATFALATVLADRHPKQKWLYYGLAAAVSLARVRSSAHFPSDILVGAGIGIYAGNHIALHGPSLFSIEF